MTIALDTSRNAPPPCDRADYPLRGLWLYAHRVNAGRAAGRPSTRRVRLAAEQLETAVRVACLSGEYPPRNPVCPFCGRRHA